MTGPEGLVLNNPNAYVLPPTSKTAERLNGLYESNKELFWFFEGVNNPTFIQCFGSYDPDCFQYPNSVQPAVEHPIHMSLGLSTIASDPENKLNEDAFLHLDFSDDPQNPRQLLAVIDGASSQMPIAALDRYGVSGAFYISHLVEFGFPKSELYKSLKSQPELSAKDIVIALNGWIKEHLEVIDGVNYNDAATIPGAAATFALIDFAKGNISLAHVADTIAVSGIQVDDNAGLTPSVDGARTHTGNLNKEFDDETHLLVNQIMEETGATRDVAAKDPRVKEQLRASFRRKINIKCGILNGQDGLVTNNLIEENNIDLLNLQQDGKPAKSFSLILASDGFYSVFPPGQDGEVDALAVAEFGSDFFGRKNATVVEDVREAFLADPHFSSKPRLKLVDDITLVCAGFGIDTDWNRD
jgi:hypothetical protein